MKVAIPLETRPGERRVALVPELVGRLTTVGYEVVVEPGAGAAASYADDDYVAAGAAVDSHALDDVEAVLSVHPLTGGRLQRIGRGTAVVSFLPVGQETDAVRAYQEGEVTAFAMELIPRISRAQSMDALSSQALVSGYRAAIVAAERLPRFLPLSMTAAGTVAPAKVLVLGAGVAGLQAIATTKRLGAVVEAYDVRAASAEEIRSLGAAAVDLDLDSLEGTGGYAREMTQDRAEEQRRRLSPYIADADILITTAAVPGRQAPRLVTREQVERMRPGSVVVDLAAETGGNVEGSVPGEEVLVGTALVWGAANVPSQMPGPASRLYAQNVVNLLLSMTTEGALAPDFDDEVVAGCCVTHAGVIRHEPTRELLEGAATR